jgi:response regulator RpfG family c-di-GMP phosphodiesterase
LPEAILERDKEREMRGNILIVDDELGVRESFRMILKDEYKLFIHSEPDEALLTIKKNCIDVALLDIRMPKMNGIELLGKIKKIDPGIQVVMVTGYATLDTAVKAMRFGAFDYLNKPFDRDKLEELVKEGIKRRKRRDWEKKELKRLEIIKKDVNERLGKIYSSTVESLMAALEAKDSYTSNHSEGVAEYAILILEELNLNLSSESREIFRYVCTLHDIGKIGVSEQILRKKGKLNKKEWKEIKKHPEIGVSILQPIEFLEKFVPMVLYHHEHFDGGGYPEGKKGEDIPLWARVLAVADSYHAMRSDRPYRLAMSEEDALEELKAEAGGQFDPEIVKVAVKVLREKKRTS